MRAFIVAVLCAASSILALPTALATPAHRGLPADGPAALYRREPSLPKAAGWPGSNTAFPRTSGTGRLADGGLYWTDYLYDDHGTTTTSTGGTSVTAGTPSFGTYTYPPGPAHNNGADIFRAAVLLRRHTSYWRVDWNTLASPAVPIAEWTFDRDDKASTGGSAWPAAAGVSSPGIGRALVVSARGARLLSVPSGRVVARLPTTVDQASQSFVVAIPNRILHPHGRWRIRLAAGLANPAGVDFAAAADADPGQTHVYNVGFRRRSQETPTDDFWNDMAQTAALRTGDVSRFSTVVLWSRLRHRVRTPQARPHGWSDRWYVSSVDLGAGVVTSPQSVSDLQPNYLGRVQPYALYVPRHAPRRMPVTFLLHSSNQNHNQYAATTPHFTQQACEARHSICVSPLGRGPDGNYWDYAELDFWQVWHAVATAYRLDPNHTVLSGYSMGGEGSNQLAMEHPDLFARSVTLAGGIGNIPSLVNLRWVPTYLAGGAEDELVPVTAERAEADRLEALGYRFRWLVVSAIDHVSYELADSFADAAHYMGHAARSRHPGRIDFTWTPRNATPTEVQTQENQGIDWTQLPRIGVGTTGVYWLRQLRARARSRDASVAATSGERPDRRVNDHRSQRVDPTMKPEPSLVTQLTWSRGSRPRPTPRLTLHLANVRSVRVKLRAAGFKAGRRGRLAVTTDGATTIRLGTRRLHVHRGHHVVPFVS